MFSNSIFECDFLIGNDYICEIVKYVGININFIIDVFI